ncbi:hypothetical protein CHLRE_12g554100v5 [Chlamydomonas reinhardtii]|uniref:Uncharacterized protein n=1 Tax=Chlamydomonas reinhardtii TaxID=3055 RepID=A0A2K3D5Y3_CHLRE|nr:uncharacterized protein CHLRE_12g554100v5 [Chlamydomonas reinhardtii]PNW75938.1 hypothetical protein CHLRE_12g554100v5 [Chlamydomonas reinhardtii]
MPAGLIDMDVLGAPSFLFAGASEGPGRVLVSSMGTAATSVAGRAAERRLAASRPPPSRSKKTIMNACTYVTNSHEYGNGNFTEARNCIPNFDAAPYLQKTIGKTGSVWAKASLQDSLTTIECFKHNNFTKEGQDACRADRKNRCWVYNGQCGNAVLNYVVYGGDGKGAGAACKGAPQTENRRCQSLFKDECTPANGCVWNMVSYYGTWDNYVRYEPMMIQQNGGPTIFGACMSPLAQEILIANYKSSNMSEQYFNDTALAVVWNAPNGPGNDFGTCAFATALRQSRAYQNACIYANTIMAHPEIDPSIMAVAVENGTTPGAIDMAASVQQCLANGCTIHPWSAAFLSASYGAKVTSGHYECIFSQGEYQSFFLNPFTDGGVYTQFTQCTQPHRHASKERCEAVKIEV